MIKKKVCLVGSFAVGKTSLTSRFVSGIFSEKYLTTIGVKIDRKEVMVDGAEVLLVVWDLAGEEEFASHQALYLKGASGFLVVADGTRPKTLAVAREYLTQIEENHPGCPSVLLINKSDLIDEWAITDVDLEFSASLPCHLTSAKTGDHVEDAFQDLAVRMLASQTE